MYLKILKGLVIGIGISAGVIILIALVLLITSRWHITSSFPMSQENMSVMTLAGLLKGYEVIPADWLPGLPKIVVKDKLNVNDAFVNAFGAIGFWIAFIPTMIIQFFVGIFEGSWSTVILSILAIPMSPLIAIFLWLAMLFQPISLGFFIVWLFLGFITNILGLFLGVFSIILFAAAPTTVITVTGGTVKVRKE